MTCCTAGQGRLQEAAPTACSRRLSGGPTTCAACPWSLQTFWRAPRHQCCRRCSPCRLRHSARGEEQGDGSPCHFKIGARRGKQVGAHWVALESTQPSPSSAVCCLTVSGSLALCLCCALMTHLCISASLLALQRACTHSSRVEAGKRTLRPATARKALEGFHLDSSSVSASRACKEPTERAFSVGHRRLSPETHHTITVPPLVDGRRR